jgi:nucleoside phosphorylase
MNFLGRVFFSKCAFCETKFVKVEDGALAFFRPREEALQTDGTSAPDHYWWLSWEWSNLYLACAICINAKGQAFPTGKPRTRPETYGSNLQSEEPLLLDPCLDDTGLHLVFRENGEVSAHPNSDRGLVTIKVLDLNRESLLSARRERALLVRELLLKCFQVTDAAALASLTEELKSYYDNDQPYAGMVRQLLRGWVVAVNSTPLGDVPQTLREDRNWCELLERLLPPSDEGKSEADGGSSEGDAQTKYGAVRYRTTMSEWPRNLVKAVENGLVIPFAGSGVAMALRRPDGGPLVPDWRGLLYAAADWLDENQRPEEATLLRQRLNLDSTFAEAFRTVYKELGTEFLSFLQDKLDPPRHVVDDASLELARALWRLSSNFVVTIGHDQALRWACPDASALELIEVSQVLDAMQRMGEGLTHPTLWHAFGTLEGGDPIITFDAHRSLVPDSSAESRLSATAHSLQELFASPYTILFVATTAPYFFSTQLFKWANGRRHYWLVRQDEFDKCRHSLRERDLPMIQPVSFPDFESLPSLLSKLAEHRSPTLGGAPQAKHLTTVSHRPQSIPGREKQPDNRSGEAPITQSFDVSIVCALHIPELEKVLKTGEQPWETLPQLLDDPHTYYHTTYTTQKGNSIRVIAAAPNQMGLAASAVLATKMILRFHPRLVAMVGIAAGIATDSQGFGDILAAEHTFDYGAGKVTAEEGKLIFKPDPKPLEIHTKLHGRLKEWQARRTGLNDIYEQWEGPKPDKILRLHVGPLGSGAAVIDTKEPVADVKKHWRKLVGVEMEAYAVHRACKDTVTPEPMYLCLKSICDFAEKKEDAWQPYAAFTAAQLFYRFLIIEWENLFG